jgi:hypothetical protein
MLFGSGYSATDIPLDNPDWQKLCKSLANSPATASHVLLLSSAREPVALTIDDRFLNTTTCEFQIYTVVLDLYDTDRDILDGNITDFSGIIPGGIEEPPLALMAARVLRLAPSLVIPPNRREAFVECLKVFVQMFWDVDVGEVEEPEVSSPLLVVLDRLDHHAFTIPASYAVPLYYFFPGVSLEIGREEESPVFTRLLAGLVDRILEYVWLSVAEVRDFFVSGYPLLSQWAASTDLVGRFKMACLAGLAEVFSQHGDDLSEKPLNFKLGEPGDGFDNVLNWARDVLAKFGFQDVDRKSAEFTIAYCSQGSEAYFGFCDPEDNLPPDPADEQE